MSTLFTADTHFGHANILRYQAATRPFKDLNHMHEAIIANWNRVVKPTDTVYHLGDFGFGPAVRLARKRLNGKIRLILGNHDKFGLEDAGIFESIDTLKLVDVDGQRIVLCHYAMRTWQFQSKGAWQLYGHCIDEASEILTSTGWKKHDQLYAGETLPSYNPLTGVLEIDKVQTVLVYPDFEGLVFAHAGKSVDYVVTEGHCMTGFDRKGAFIEAPASVFCRTPRMRMMCASALVRPGISLTDDEIRLYVWLAADGTLANRTLGRIRVKKIRKAEAVQRLLEALGISFTENVQKDSSRCFNFTVPGAVRQLNVKGLDRKLMEMNARQFEVLLSAYEITDGHRIGDSIVIYSAKEQEIDLLQELAVTHGYRATKYSRYSGFSNKLQHQLTVTKAPLAWISNSHMPVCRPHRGLMWCIKNRNQNFLCRRNGRVHLTGNSHGNLAENLESLSTDVGVDRWNMTPVSVAQLRGLMSTRIWKPIDHHGRDDE
jgi:calcineurin-like phosphoesterase family protein